MIKAINTGSGLLKSLPFFSHISEELCFLTKITLVVFSSPSMFNHGNGLELQSGRYSGTSMVSYNMFECLLVSLMA